MVFVPRREHSFWKSSPQYSGAPSCTIIFGTPNLHIHCSKIALACVLASLCKRGMATTNFEKAQVITRSHGCFVPLILPMVSMCTL